MAEELQNLLEKIQKDGINKADEQTSKLLSEAKTKAAAIVADATAKADDIIKKAEQDGKAFQTRAEKSLEQAGRDTVLAVEAAISNALKSIVEADTAKTLSSENFNQTIADVVKAYSDASAGASSIELLVSPERLKDIQDYFTSRLANEMKAGLKIKSDDSIIAGFKVSVVDDNILHDFTSEAITETLCVLLRPNIAEILKASQKS